MAKKAKVSNTNESEYCRAVSVLHRLPYSVPYIWYIYHIYGTYIWYVQHTIFCTILESSLVPVTEHLVDNFYILWTTILVDNF